MKTRTHTHVLTHVLAYAHAQAESAGKGNPAPLVLFCTQVFRFYQKPSCVSSSAAGESAAQAHGAVDNGPAQGGSGTRALNIVGVVSGTH